MPTALDDRVASWFTYRVHIEQETSDQSVTWISSLPPEHFQPGRVFEVEGMAILVRGTHEPGPDEDLPFDLIIDAERVRDLPQ
ncbi:MAG TPA: hypothetical protein VGJ49_00350 [Gaiellaceae bacterium]|jgi:hypothetical protein